MMRYERPTSSRATDTLAELYAVYGIELDSSGSIYVTDISTDHVREVFASTGIIDTVAGNGTPGYGGAANCAMLSLPRQIAVTPSR